MNLHSNYDIILRENVNAFIIFREFSFSGVSINGQELIENGL
jgi:hypothetical protein